MPISPKIIERIKRKSSGDNPAFTTRIYADISDARDKTNIIIEITGLLIFISSFFFDAFSMSISLYLEIVT
ncbi:hypothetical protein D3C81_919210 [compost metagenome]